MRARRCRCCRWKSAWGNDGLSTTSAKMSSAGSRFSLSVDNATRGLEGGVRVHLERPIAVAEPARRGGLEIPGGRRRDAPLRHEVMIGAAREHFVPGQHVRLAAEAADPLDAADEARARLCLDAAQLTRGRT